MVFPRAVSVVVDVFQRTVNVTHQGGAAQVGGMRRELGGDVDRPGGRAERAAASGGHHDEAVALVDLDGARTVESVGRLAELVVLNIALVMIDKALPRSKDGASAESQGGHLAGPGVKGGSEAVARHAHGVGRAADSELLSLRADGRQRSAVGQGELTLRHDVAGRRPSGSLIERHVDVEHHFLALLAGFLYSRLRDVEVDAD